MDGSCEGRSVVGTKVRRQVPRHRVLYVPVRPGSKRRREGGGRRPMAGPTAAAAAEAATGATSPCRRATATIVRASVFVPSSGPRPSAGTDLGLPPPTPLSLRNCDSPSGSGRCRRCRRCHRCRRCRWCRRCRRRLHSPWALRRKNCCPAGTRRRPGRSAFGRPTGRSTRCPCSCRRRPRLLPVVGALSAWTGERVWADKQKKKWGFLFYFTRLWTGRSTLPRFAGTGGNVSNGGLRQGCQGRTETTSARLCLGRVMFTFRK